MFDNQVHGTLLGVMIGDALGAPVESMTAAEIREKIGAVEGFIDVVQWRITDTQSLERGQTTDDWQLTCAVADALMVADGYDATAMAISHMNAYEARSIGWGGTTDRAVQELIAYRDSYGFRGRQFDAPVGDLGKGMGGGNGVAMKCAPLVIAYALKGDYAGMTKALKRLALMTHVKPEPYWCALAYATMLYGALTQRRLYNCIEIIAHMEPYLDESAEETIGQLRRADERVGDVPALISDIGPRFSAIESVPFAMAMTWSHEPGDLLLACVNAGGDADSTTAMAGALIGGCYGTDVFPEAWRTFRPEYTQAHAYATALVQRYGDA